MSIAEYVSFAGAIAAGLFSLSAALYVYGTIAQRNGSPGVERACRLGVGSVVTVACVLVVASVLGMSIP